MTTRHQLLEKLIGLQADIERMRSEREVASARTAREGLTLSIVNEINSRIALCPSANDYDEEHVTVLNNLPNQQVEFRVLRGGKENKVTLSWATEKFVMAMSNPYLVTALETRLEGDRLKIVSVNTPERFIALCMKALGYDELKNAA